MWLDGDGVMHTVALPDPRIGMSSATVASLDALDVAERKRLQDLLDGVYLSDFMEASAATFEGVPMGPEYEPLPDGYLTGIVSSADAGLEMVKATELAWRLDVLEAILDLVEEE